MRKHSMNNFNGAHKIVGCALALLLVSMILNSCGSENAQQAPDTSKQTSEAGRDQQANALETAKQQGDKRNEDTRMALLTAQGKPVRTGDVITVKKNGHLKIRGWALDTPAKAPASGVSLCIDDIVVFPAEYGIASPAVAVKDPKFSNCGFVIDVDCSSISHGRHKAIFRVFGGDSSYYYEPTNYQLTINVE
jgi:hypothetical protein